MNKRAREYRYELMALLGRYGISGTYMKKKFLKEIVSLIEDQVSDQICGYAKQTAVDALCSVMQEHGYGVARWQKLEQEFRERINDFDIMAEDEAIDNIRNGNGEDIPFTKDKIDDEVKRLYEGYFLPYDERYKKAQDEEHSHNWTELREIADDA